jgi:hypothetical protein
MKLRDGLTRPAFIVRVQFQGYSCDEEVVRPETITIYVSGRITHSATIIGKPVQDLPAIANSIYAQADELISCTKEFADTGFYLAGMFRITTVLRLQNIIGAFRWQFWLMMNISINRRTHNPDRPRIQTWP